MNFGETKKGQQVYIEGRFKSRSYEEQDGPAKFTNETTLTDVQFLRRAVSNNLA